MGFCDAQCPWRWQGQGHGEMSADNREQVYAAYHHMGYDEFVCPSNFRNLAEYVIKWPFDHFHESKDVSVRDWAEPLARCLLPAAIVYAQTTWCEFGRAAKSPDDRPCGEGDAPCLRLFHQKESPLRTPIILLTGQSDYNAHDFCGLAINPDTQTGHPLLVHWFGQNGNLPPNPLFSPLPIGVNCFEMAAALRAVLVQRYIRWPARTSAWRRPRVGRGTRSTSWTTARRRSGWTTSTSPSAGTSTPCARASCTPSCTSDATAAARTCGT